MAGNQVRYGPNGPGNQAPGRSAAILMRTASRGRYSIKFRSTCRRFHEATLRVILFPLAGAPAVCHNGRSCYNNSYQPFTLVPNPDGVVVCTAKLHHKFLSPQLGHTNTTYSERVSTKRGIAYRAWATYPSASRGLFPSS
jgi:hypothetical protein